MLPSFSAHNHETEPFHFCKKIVSQKFEERYHSVLNQGINSLGYQPCELFQ